MEELALRLNPPVTVPTIAKLEHGQMRLTLDYMVQIAEALHVPISQLIPGESAAKGPPAIHSTVFVLNGPNLNLLGTREPSIYGADTLDDIAAMLTARGRELGIAIDMRQSNHEGHLVDWLHEANGTHARAVILNAGALTHSSIALYDAIRAISVPVIEVHLSNPHAREAFRHHSYVSLAARGVIAGLGAYGYVLALDAAARL